MGGARPSWLWVPAVKYHYSDRFFTYPVRRGGEPRGGLSLLAPSASGARTPFVVPGTTRSGDSVWWGV